MHHVDFDYFSWWKHAVSVLNVAPSEAWGLDYVELAILSDIKPKQHQDGSHMVNAKRKMNGMLQSDLKNIY